MASADLTPNLEVGGLTLELETSVKFVKLCALKFGWGELSGATVMDLGCGKDLPCAKTVLEHFPKVKSIIALDSSREQLDAITFRSDKIVHFLADITHRREIRQYERKVDKIVSTNVLHQIPSKERVFRNVYRLLKSGGEAAFLFTSDLGIYHVLESLQMDDKYKDYFKGSDITEWYSRKLKSNDYREILERYRFEVIEITEMKDHMFIEQYGLFENTLFKSVAAAFSVPSELVTEINEAASNLYRTKFSERRSIYASTEISILVKKRSDVSRNTCSNS
ncbi:Juvenile hormone acid O-methyltransferase like protein [Argiope bruennichi]|uniref:Juvenile hormone acid O-methyltransferase like protein n=1 Tax=Argiope bruennichi TaxID=94029 RepID=A0A8T0EWA0_ARGBR|nr:Juvenile hormone acid O-methyltransferase like protein [Argiope bruennichi]